MLSSEDVEVGMPILGDVMEEDAAMRSGRRGRRCLHWDDPLACHHIDNWLRSCREQVLGGGLVLSYALS